MSQPIGPQAVTGEWVTRLANLVHEIRTDWQEPGIRAALAKVADRPLLEVAAAALAATGRVDQRTPAVIALDGEHWRILNPEPAPAPRSPVILTYCEHGLPGRSCRECFPPEVVERALPTAEQKAAIRAAVAAGRAELARIEQINEGRPAPTGDRP